VTIVLKSVNLSLVEPSVPVQACNGIALPSFGNSFLISRAYKTGAIPKPQTVCNSTTVQHYSSTTVQQYSITTVKQYNSTAVQKYKSTAVQQYNSTAVQQYNSTAVQEYSSTAVQ